MSDLPDFVQALGHGIYCIDTGFQRPLFDASYLIAEGSRAAFVDTGTNHSVPRLLAALAATGLAPEAVDFVIPTHVHLDHAGGAGLLMQQLPAAQLVVHPLGARHLINPWKLVAGARAVYGDAEFERAYGTVVPVPAERVLESFDGMELLLAQRPLRLLDTPGHARHHHCLWDECSRSFFTGDTFGLSYREFDTAQGAWVLPTTTPVQFDPVALRSSIERLLSFSPDAMQLTHFGRVTNVAALGVSLLAQLDELVAASLSLRDQPDRHARLVQALRAMYLARVAAHGCRLAAEKAIALLCADIELNAQGIAVWLDKTDGVKTKTEAAPG